MKTDWYTHLKKEINQYRLKRLCSYSIVPLLFDNRATDVTGESNDAHAVELKTTSHAAAVKKLVRNVFTVLPYVRVDQRLGSQRKTSRTRTKQQEPLVLSTCLLLALLKSGMVYHL